MKNIDCDFQYPWRTIRVNRTWMFRIILAFFGFTLFQLSLDEFGFTFIILGFGGDWYW